MRSFNFNTGYRSGLEATSDQGVIDSLIDAAGGAPLPGKWGLAQAIITLWARESEGWGPLFYTKQTLSTVGVIRAYRRANNPDLRKKVDPMRDYREKKALTTPVQVKDLAHFIFSFCEDLPVVEVPITEADAGPCSRIYTLPNGVEVEFMFYSPYNGESDQFSGYGPYIKTTDHTKGLAGISRVIWEAEGDNDLQLSGVDDPWYGFKFQIGVLSEPGDYVSEGHDETWKSVEHLVDRCTKFQRKGMSRRILFYGPPGTGKTTLARHVARSVGRGKALRIEPVALAHLSTSVAYQFINLLRPSVILMDDIDRNADDAESLLHYLERSAKAGDDWGESTTVIGTVNDVGAIDPALLRPGRFDEVLLVNEPDEGYRKHIIRHYLDVFGLDDATLKKAGFKVSALTTQMDGFAPADIREVLSCASAVGVEMIDAEIERVRIQRLHYQGDKVKEYLKGRTPSDGDPESHP